MKKRVIPPVFRTLSLLLMLVLLFQISVAAVTDAESDQARLYRGTFMLRGNKETFYYSDGYFLNPDANGQHLMTLSAAAAFSLRGNSKKETVDLLTDIGMDPDSIEAKEIVKGTPDTIGTVIAHKTVGEKTIVALVIRGDAYDGEWASNFLAGTEGDASGFSKAASVVSERLTAYLDDYAISDAIIWVSGYSRGGGIANLIGRYLNESPEKYRTSLEDIFVYTYEAPRSSADASVYSNIHNVMDINDVVTYLYPEAWGLHLNGVPYMIGDKSEMVMGKSFYLLDSEHIQNFEEQPTAEFLNQFESFLANGLSREEYANNYESTLSTLIALFYSKDEDDQKKLADYFTKALNNVQERSDFSALIFSIWLKSYTDSNIAGLTNALTDELKAARETEAPPLTDDEFNVLLSSVKTLSDFVLKLGNGDQYKTTTQAGRKVTLSFYHLLTFSFNAAELVKAHYSTSVWKQLCAQDPYYTEGVSITPGDLYIGQNCYTNAEYGDQIDSLALENGFTSEDLALRLNGYDLRIENVMTEITDPDTELILKASGTLDKSMVMYSYYKITMNKKVGFRTYPIEGVKFLRNRVSVTLPKEIGDTAPRFAVVQVDNSGSAKLPIRFATKENGEVELCFNAAVPAIYAFAYDGYGSLVLADVDRDGQVSVMDVTHIQRYLADLEYFGDYQFKAADIDGDGEVTIIDATWIKRRLALMSTPYEIGGLLE